jgi:hypothetical protein
MGQEFNTDPQRSEMQPQMQRPASAAAPQSEASGYESPAPRGQFYTPPPSATSPAVPSSTENSKWRLVGFGFVATVALVAAGWYGISTHAGSGNGGIHPPIAASVQKTFAVSAKDLDQKATDSLKAFFSGSSSDTSAAANALHAVNGRGLMEQAKSNPQLADDFKSGRRVLYRVHLLDYLDEDGDHAELFVNGVSLGDVYLRNAGTEILIPLMAGAPTQIKLLATVDGGGGGVTVGFVSSLGEARTRTMQVGEFEEWQVTVQ